MKLIEPTDPFSINQPFGANYNGFYSEAGWKGHTGLDIACEHGQVVRSACDGYVYSLMNKDNTDLNRYRAVYVLYDDGVDAFEVSYGHATDILVKKGDMIKAGDPVITAGNTGDVASGGTVVTLEEKLKGSTRGTHLHFQVRKVEKVKELKYSDWRLSDEKGSLFHNGFYYKILNTDNGYAGCIDPMIYMDIPFSKVLKYGTTDAEVVKVQNYLKNKGFFPITTESTGYFGPITAEAVRNWQVSNNILDFQNEKNLKNIIWGKKSISKANGIT